MAKDNRLLGVFQLVGIPPAPRGMPQIEVTFDIDANGILNVTAKDKATNNEQKITITSSSGSRRTKSTRWPRTPIACGRRPQRQRPIEARNRADAMVYNVEKTLKEHRDKIGDDDAKNIEAAIEDVQEADQRERSREAERGHRPSDAGQPQAGGGDVQGFVAARRRTRRRAGRGAHGGRPGAPSRKKMWSTPSSST